MRVALVTAVWRRHALTQVFWEWTAYLREWWAPAIELVCIVAGSGDPEHERLAAAAGAEYIDVPNTPLGRKWNMGLGLAKGFHPDAVLIMGSDDFFCERTAQIMGAIARSGNPYTGLGDFYFYDAPTERLGYFAGYQNPRKPHRHGEPSGSGRLIPADYLRRLGWKLWKEKPQMDARFPNHGVDHGSFKRLRIVAPHPPLIWLREICGTAIGIKGVENLWVYDHTHPEPLPDPETRETVLARIPESLRAGVADLCLSSV